MSSPKWAKNGSGEFPEFLPDSPSRTWGMIHFQHFFRSFPDLVARLRGRRAAQRSKKGSGKVLGRVLGKVSQKGSEKGLAMGLL